MKTSFCLYFSSHVFFCSECLNVLNESKSNDIVCVGTGASAKLTSHLERDLQLCFKHSQVAFFTSCPLNSFNKHSLISGLMVFFLSFNFNPTVACVYNDQNMIIGCRIYKSKLENAVD